jgi:hypothetical protein
MNKRIRLLALQARLGPALLLHHWGKIDALTDSEQEGLEQIKKFAELIVQECIDVIGEDNYTMLTGKAYCTELKRHFGVKE